MNAIKTWFAPALILATWAALGVSVLGGYSQRLVAHPHARLEETITVTAPDGPRSAAHRGDERSQAPRLDRPGAAVL